MEKIAMFMLVGTFLFDAAFYMYLLGRVVCCVAGTTTSFLSSISGVANITPVEEKAFCELKKLLGC